MANRLIGGILSSKQPVSGGFVSRASTGTYFNQTGTLITTPVNQTRLNYSFNGSPAANRYSALFTSASTNYLSTVTAASALGTGNFTMEFWWRANSTTQSNYSNVINQGFTGSPSNGAFAFKIFAGTGSNVLNFTYYNSGISDNATSANVNDLAWHHIAASRNGTSLGIYVDGTLSLTITLPASFNMGASGGTTYIGYNPRDASYINGYVKDVRLITGQALYSGAFTPPTAPLTTTSVGSTGAGAAATLSGTVILLTCQTASLNDVSGNNYAITNTNAVTASLLLPNQLGIDTSGTGWTQPAVLIEPASTNQCLYSIPTTAGSVWTAAQSTITANSTTAPDGTTTATLLTEDGTSSSYHVAFTSGGNSMTPSAGVYTCSIFAKAGTRNNVFLQWAGDNAGTRVAVNFNLTTGAVGTNIGTQGTPTQYGWSSTPVGNGWWRLSVYAYQTTNTLYMVVGTAINDSAAIVGGSAAYFTGGTGGTVYFWGAQQELGRTATSYIPTSGSTVTRSQDITGVVGSGMYTLAQLENQTAIDDQATVQSFTSTGSTTWTAPLDVTSVEVLVVAGGGGGSENTAGGGGGAGGVIYNSSYPVTPGVTYPVTVGAGGATTSNGQNSNFANINAIGGGTGGDYGNPTGTTGRSGGSGGGGGFCQVTAPALGGPGIYTQGNAGGTGSTVGTGGGGGAGGGGGNATGAGGGGGGPGLAFNISGTLVYYGGGGGGGAEASGSSGVASGGVGGGGNGAYRPSATVATSGTANTGGGGGGCYNLAHPSAGTGGSGVVIVKYKRTPRQISSVSNAAVVVQKFTVSNTWIAPAGVTNIEALVVAGGGGGGNGTAGGGGGAGGVVYNSALTVTPGSTYTIGVGGGGLGAGDAAATSAYNGFGSGIGTGTELITNGSAFTVTTGWTATTATLSVPQAGTFRITPNISVNGTASQSITTVNGVTYVAVIKVTFDTSKLLRIRVGTTQVGSEVNDGLWTERTKDTLDNNTSGAGFYSQTFTATSTTTWINLQVGGGTSQPTDISYISVRQASLPAFGGGRGASEGDSGSNTGGSGGGGRYGLAGSAGTAGQGNAGGSGYSSVANVWTGGGGGGAGSAGGNAITFYPGNGGAGVAYAITGNLEYYGGGGGGSSQNYGVGTVYPGLGGIGGGGTGAADQTSSTVVKGGDGAPNTGGGGGAQANQTGSGSSGHGGSGVVILRYRVPLVVTFLDSGAWTCPAGVTSVQALVVAGGGGGGAGATGSQLGGGGAGAGGLIYSSSVTVIPGTTYSVVVGQGGSGGITGTSAGTNGQNSSFANLIAIGGGFGGVRSVSETGGSGGSGGAGAGNPVLGGAGTYGQGNNGAGGQIGAFGGGGGGAGTVGSAGQATTEPTGGSGGTGLQFSISGTATYYAGGGSSGAWGGDQIVPASLGGGGAGGLTRTSGYPGLQNTGGGGGGSGSGYRNVSVDTAATKNGAHGGSGIVIIRWYGG